MNGALVRKAGGVLSALLVVSTLLVVLGRSSDLAEPTLTSSKPSGTRLFGEVLQSQGFRIEQSRDRLPKLEGTESAIAFVRVRENLAQWPDTTRFDTNARDSAIKKRLSDIAAAGSTVFLFYISGQFNEASQSVLSPDKITNLLESNAPAVEVSAQPVGSSGVAWLQTPDREAVTLDAWSTSLGQTLVSYEKVGKGTVVHVRDGIGVTNRFIDQGQNAAFYSNLVKRSAIPGTTLVFTEATFGNIAADSLMSSLGGWARATSWQVFLLFLVVAWSSSVAFGLPHRARSRQRGTRDLMEAYATLMMRSRKKHKAGQQIFEAVELELKRSVSLHASASTEDLLRRLPERLSTPFHALRSALHDPNKSVNLVELEAFRRAARAFRDKSESSSHQETETIANNS